VFAARRHGLDPTAACRHVIERLARLRGSKVAASQVALLALDKQGRAGAFALQPGFTWAVTDAAGRTRIERAGALFEAP
jgi:N4-(beta-N-acetylglucosaminyl)-L-asparaginase